MYSYRFYICHFHCQLCEEQRYGSAILYFSSIFLLNVVKGFMKIKMLSFNCRNICLLTTVCQCCLLLFHLWPPSCQLSQYWECQRRTICLVHNLQLSIYRTSSQLLLCATSICRSSSDYRIPVFMRYLLFAYITSLNTFCIFRKLFDFFFLHILPSFIIHHRLYREWRALFYHF